MRCVPLHRGYFHGHGHGHGRHRGHGHLLLEGNDFSTSHRGSVNILLLTLFGSPCAATMPKRTKSVKKSNRCLNVDFMMTQEFTALKLLRSGQRERRDGEQEFYGGEQGQFIWKSIVAKMQGWNRKVSVLESTWHWSLTGEIKGKQGGKGLQFVRVPLLLRHTPSTHQPISLLHLRVDGHTQPLGLRNVGQMRHISFITADPPLLQSDWSNTSNAHSTEQ